ncbi:MAG: hypothetical protein OQL19_10050 [Gammaproteobacteria bacterium]|nr:hypothetical protein [Gammaproteobacteria bacterium]
MSNRTYRLIVGALLLVFLYFDLNFGIYALIVALFIEGFSNFLIPDIINRIRYVDGQSGNDENLAPIQNKSRFSFSAERAWRLVVALMLLIAFVLFNSDLSNYFQILPLDFIEQFSYINWFFPWFMGFAIFGAGISGVCPVLITVKWIGFK